MRTALIDGDCIAYILGWNLREESDEGIMRYSIDNFLNTQLVLLEATHYVGALSSKEVFRHQVYKFAPYKGTRKDDQPDIARWKPVVNDYLRSKWGFVSIPKLEADDIVGYLAFDEKLGERIVCSPDKDLRQVPGILYNIQSGVMETITPEEAKRHLNLQLLCGDTTDNIKGLPGIGDVKARKMLEIGTTVYDAYIRHFGNYYGSIIYEETLATVMVMQPDHIYEPYFINDLKKLEPCKTAEDTDNVFLRELEN